MQLALLLLLSLSHSEGRLYTFQPFTFYHFPTIPSQTQHTAVSPLQVPISPRLLLYPNNQQSVFNSPFPPNNVYTYFLTPSGNVLTATDDLQREVGVGNGVEASPHPKTSFVSEQFSTTNEEKPFQEEAPFISEQVPTINEEEPFQEEAPFGSEQLSTANEEETFQEEALSSGAGFGAPRQKNGDVLPSASSSATTSLLAPVSVSPQHSSRIRTEDGLGGYHFRYSEGSSSRDETRDHKGTVRGSYGVMDRSGKVRTYHYVADAGGFRISGPGLPSQNPLETPVPNEILSEPTKMSIPESIWPDTIQEDVHQFPVVSEPSNLKLETRQFESFSTNDPNVIEGARDNVQLAHPYMSQTAYEAVYGTPAVSVSKLAPMQDEVQNDQSSGHGLGTRDPADFGVVEPTTTEAVVIEITTTEPFTGTESSAVEPSPTPWGRIET